MRIKPGLSAIAATALIAGLCGCGGSASTSGSGAASATSQSPSTEPATPTATAAAGKATSASPQAPKAALITIKDFKFTVPASVAPGSKITVKNADDASHTVTSSTKGAFDVKADGGGGTSTFTAPTKPGSYPFVCTFHANMMGTLVVK